MIRFTLGIGLAMMIFIGTACGGGTACKADGDCATGFTCDVPSGKCNARAPEGSTGHGTTGASATTAASAGSSTGAHSSSASSTTATTTAASATSTTGAQSTSGASTTTTASTSGTSSTSASTSTATSSTAGGAAASTASTGSSGGTAASTASTGSSGGSTTSGSTSTSGSSGTASGSTGGVCAGGCTISVSNDQQSGYPNQVLANPVIFKVRASGSPVVGLPLTITAPPGVSATPSSGTTNAQGQFSTIITLGRSSGVLSMSAAGGGATASFSATVTAPPPGMIYPVFVTGIYQVNGIAAAPDGTLYLSVGNPSRQVISISTAGVSTVIAGNGQAGVGGEGVSPTSAPLDGPGALLLDSANQLLYISEVNNNRVRVLDINAKLISTFAGGGTGGDGQLATAASLNSPGALALMSDGSVLISDRGNNRIRRVDPNGIIHAFLGGAACAAAGQIVGPAIPLADASGAVFVGGGYCDSVNASSPGIIWRDATGVSVRSGGNPAGASTDGAQGVESAIGNVTSLAEDAAGNLFFSTDDHRVRRLDASTGQLTTIAGVANSSTSTGDYAAAASATFAGTDGLAMDGSGTLYVVDTASGAVRAIAAAGSSNLSPVSLVVTANDQQTVYVDQLTPLPIKLTLSSGSSGLNGFDINWTLLTPGATLPNKPMTKTGANGLALQQLTPGLSPGAYSFKASFSNLRGQAVSTVQVTVNAVAPPAGTIFGSVNQNSINLGGARGAAFPMGNFVYQPLILSTWAVASGDSDSIFFHDSISSFIYQMTSDGVSTPVAGATGTRTNTGDNGPPLGAGFSDNAWGMAYHAASQTLFYAVAPNNLPAIIRAIDFKNNVVTTIAGGGTSIADGIPATAADLTRAAQNSSGALAVTSDRSLWLVENTAGLIRKISGSNGTISTVVAAKGCTAGYTGVAGVLGSIAVDPSDNLFFSGVWCSNGTAWTAIIERTAGGGLLSVVGGPTAAGCGWDMAGLADGLSAGAVNFTGLSAVAVSPGGDVSWYETGGGCGGQITYARLRKIDHTTGKVVTVAGSTSQARSTSMPEYVSASTMPFVGSGAFSGDFYGFGYTTSGHAWLNLGLNNQLDPGLVTIW